LTREVPLVIPEAVFQEAICKRKVVGDEVWQQSNLFMYKGTYEDSDK
jgi:hypothetical protein